MVYLSEAVNHEVAELLRCRLGRCSTEVRHEREPRVCLGLLPESADELGRMLLRQIEQSMGAYYPDEGNLNTSFHDNVASALNHGRPATLRNNAWWLFLWKNTIRNCPVFSNYAENGTGCWNAGSNCSMWNNTLFAPGAPPPRAAKIMAHSGTVGNVYSTTEGFGYHDLIDTITTRDDGEVRAEVGVQGFGCAAAGSPPPSPGSQPTFNPPFQHCHC